MLCCGGGIMMMMRDMVVVVVWRDACTFAPRDKITINSQVLGVTKVWRHCTAPGISMASITESHRKFFQGAEAVVKKKIQELKNRRRCLTCWHPKHLFCICSHTPPLKYKLTNVKFIIYMHYLEYANAGDDAKLLMCCSPERTKLYLHGVEIDDANMKKEIQAFKSTSLGP